jgi:hypothetical protein
MTMSDPVSWLLIRPGWKVYAADGTEVGEVDEVAGDENRDIFDGIALATSVLGQPRYVVADQVTEITRGQVRLSLTVHEVEALGDYREPATSAEIEPDSHGGFASDVAGGIRELETTVRPPERHEHSVTFVRRVYLALRRMLRR